MPAVVQQISARANLVPVPILVLDGRGNTIFGLHAQDFMIVGHGVRPLQERTIDSGMHDSVNTN